MEEGVEMTRTSFTRTHNHDDINLNEYRVCHSNGVESTTKAAKHRFDKEKGIVTFWYWRKNILINRFQLVEFSIDEVSNVSLVIDVI